MSDDTLLAQFLVDKSERKVVEWLVQRATGDDSVLRLDRKADEDTDAFLIAFMRRRGVSDAAVSKLSGAVRYVLRDLARHRPALDVHHWTVLRVCQQVYVPVTRDWFIRQLRAVDVQQQPDPVDDGVLRAATVQAHGRDSKRARKEWERLLRSRRLSTMGLYGLSRNWPQQAELIPIWWEHEPPASREPELRHMIAAGIREDVRGTLRAECLGLGAGWPQSLKDAVDRAFAVVGQPRLFRTKQQAPLWNAIDGAATLPTKVDG